MKCFADAGLPAGVLNLVFGVPANVSEYLIPSKIVKKVSFTGSIPVGKHLAGLAAKGMKRATMELGGHSPVVVFDDADAEKAADTIAAFKYRNAGQVCISPTRFYVQEKSYNKFVARFTEYAKGLKMGDGLEKGITLGPLANPRRLDAMESFVNDAKARGGKIQTGGERHGNQGFSSQPTVITDMPDDSKIMTEEPFGPLAPIVPFKTFDEVVERANSLQFGSRLTPSLRRTRPPPPSATPSSPAWWASIRSPCRRRKRRSAASRNWATARKAVSRACRPTSTPSSSRRAKRNGAGCYSLAPIATESEAAPLICGTIGAASS